MNSITWFSAALRLFCLAVAGLLAPTLRAQAPTHVYEFEGNLNNALGGTAMSSGGGTTEAFRYSFGAGQGPSVSGAVPSSGDYSLEMVFTFTSVPAYACLVNFSNLTADAGIYIGDGALPYLAPSGGTASGFSVTPMTANVPVRVIVTRNWSTQETKIYMNGTLAKTKSDTGNVYVPSAGVVHFFRDNTAGGYQGENAPGSVDQIKIYNYVLSASQVSTRGGPKGKLDLFRGTVNGTRLGQSDAVGMGSVNLGQTSAPETFTVRNSGPVNLQVSSVTAYLGTADFFTSAPASTAVSPGQTMTFQAYFSPSATGYREGAFRISNDSAEGSLEIGLNGTGVAGPLLAPAHEFEFSQGYADSAAIGNEAMAVQAGGTLGASTHTFPANGYLTGPANLVPTPADYTLEVVFRLDAVSGYRSVINFDGMAGDDAVFVQDGKIRFRTLLNVQPSASAPITAGGWHRLIVTRKAVNGQLIAYVDGVAVLTTTDQDNRYVADTRVRFFGDSTPEVSAGAVSLIRSYNGVMQPSQVTSRGAGMLPEIQVQEGTTLPGVDRADNATAYAMPNTATGNTSASRSFVIVNTGVGSLNISSMTLGGSHPGDFAVTNLGAVNLSQGSTRVLGVTFTPAALGTRTATITINSNDADEQPFRINLTGTGVTPPTVTAINPVFGTAAGGTQVTITGTGFTGATGVTIGGTAASGVSVVNATTITCTTQARAAGPCSVQIVTPVGTNAANTDYSYKAVTTPSLALTSSSAPYGSAFPVTVTVNATNPYAAPIGSVSLKEGATIVATSTLATPGTWTFPLVGLSVGTHTLTAQYDGDAWNLLSTSAGSVTFNVTQATGTLALTSSLNPMTQGGSVTYTATLTPPLNNVTISFNDGGVPMGSAQTNAAGVASFSPPAPRPYGTRSITAVFTAAANSNVSSATSPPLLQVVNQNANAIALTNLTQTYNGTPRTPGAATVPAGRTVNFTFTGTGLPAATAPTNAGTYGVTGTISDPFWGGSASGTFVISKAPATVNVTGLSQYFDGLPKPVTVTTVPAGLSHTVTYNGSPTAPSAQGSYTVAVTVTETNYSGTATETLTISTAAGTTTTLTSSQNPSVFLTQPEFTARATSATPGLTGQIAFFIDDVLQQTVPVDANGYAKFTPTADALRGGSRTIKASYNGDQAAPAFAPSTVNITQVVNKATLAVTLSDLEQVYTGTARVPTANFTPPPTHTSVQLDFTYDGSPIAPVNAGTYAVVGTINDPSLQGTASGTLTVAKAPVTASFSYMVAGYDGQPHEAHVTTTPAVPFSISYQPVVNGNLTGSPALTPPSEVGNYRVVLSHPNYAATPSQSDLTITSRGVSITLGALSVIGDGTPKPVTVITNPPGVNVAVTYTAPGDAPTATAPSAPPPGGGTWRVDATVSDANLAGTARADLLIRTRQQPVLTLSGPTTAYVGGEITYVATLPSNGTGFAPTGIVTFTSGGILLGAVQPQVNGTCRISPFLPASPVPYSITAYYGGDADYFPATSAAVQTTVSKRTLTLSTASPLVHTYDGTPKPVIFTTSAPDANVSINVTYAGYSDPPREWTPQPETVVATIEENPYYEGTASVQLTINKAPANIALGNLRHIYQGNKPYLAYATTHPPGLAHYFTYNGSDAEADRPHAIGNYEVQAFLTDEWNYAYTPPTATLVVASSNVNFEVTRRTKDYDGDRTGVTVKATPAISYRVTYAGNDYPPLTAGTYKVVVSANQAPYSGEIETTMVINAMMTASSVDEAGVADVGTITTRGLTLHATNPIGVFPGETQVEFKGRVLPTERWIFKKWEDGSTENPRKILLGGADGPSVLHCKAIAVHEELITPQHQGTAGQVLDNGKWAANGDVIRCWAVSTTAGSFFDHWSYDGNNYSGTYDRSENVVALKIRRGGGQPVGHFINGYKVEAWSAPFTSGSVAFRRSDRPNDPPVIVHPKLSIATAPVPNGVSFIATATPKPGRAFTHWTLSGADIVLPPGAHPLTGRATALQQPAASFIGTSDLAQVTANYISADPELEIWHPYGVKRPDGYLAPGVQFLAHTLICVKNTGKNAARNVKVSRAEVTGWALRTSFGNGNRTDYYYPNPRNATEQQANAVGIQAGHRLLLDTVYRPIASIIPGTKWSLPDIPGQSSVLGEPLLQCDFPWLWMPISDLISTYMDGEVRITWTIEADGWSDTVDSWVDLRMAD